MIKTITLPLTMEISFFSSYKKCVFLRTPLQREDKLMQFDYVREACSTSTKFAFFASECI